MSSEPKFACAHNANQGLCLEPHCANNPDTSWLSRKGNDALKTGNGSFEDWVRYAAHFDKTMQWEKSEACARFALQCLGSPEGNLDRVPEAVVRVLRYRLKPHLLVTLPAGRIRAAIQDAEDALWDVYRGLEPRVRKRARGTFLKLSENLRVAKEQTSSGGSRAVSRFAKLLRRYSPGRNLTFDLPERAADFFQTLIANEPKDDFLRLGLAAVHNDLHEWDKAVEQCNEALTLGGNPQYVYPCLAKALMFSGRAKQAWEILLKIKRTKSNNYYLLAQMIICLHLMEVQIDWEDEGDLDHVRAMRANLAEEIRAFDESVQNPYFLNHTVLNNLLDSAELGKAWVYLDELEAEDWKGNISLWRKRITDRALDTGIDLEYEIDQNQPARPDMWPDSDDDIGRLAEITKSAQSRSFAAGHDAGK